MQDERDPNTSDVRAVFEHLTDPSRREVTWLIQDYVIAIVDQDSTFHLRLSRLQIRPQCWLVFPGPAAPM